jgi:pimeloyl-ACP methyl ester carboxylesterase
MKPRKNMLTTTSKDGTTLAYDKCGTGSALINITGASCFRKFMPVMQDIKVFSKSFTVYNYDRRGRGDSGDTQPYSIDREVEDIEAMIDAAGGKADLYGHSSGAVLALNAAMRLPHKIGKVMIYDPAYVYDETEKRDFDLLSQKVQSLLLQGKNKTAMRTFLSGIGMPIFFVWLLPLFPGWATMAKLAPTLMYDIAMTKNFAPFDAMRLIHMPTLVMVGEKSPLGMQKVAQQISQSMSNSQFELVVGQDHMVSAKVLLPKFVKFLS